MLIARDLESPVEGVPLLMVLRDLQERYDHNIVQSRPKMPVTSFEVDQCR